MIHHPIVWLVLTLLDIYFWIVVIAVIASWLVGFGVINTHNHFARRALLALHALTDPVFRPLRKILPAVGGLDLSPMVVILTIWFLQYLIGYYAFKYGY